MTGLQGPRPVRRKPVRKNGSDVEQNNGQSTGHYQERVQTRNCTFEGSNRRELRPGSGYKQATVVVLSQKEI